MLQSEQQAAIKLRKVLHGRWYPVVNDLVGGWSVATTNKTVAELNLLLSEFDVADVWNEEIATQIAELHNAWLDTQPVKTCVYCGSEYEVPGGWKAVVEKTCDIEPPAQVVAWQTPVDERLPRFSSAVVLHECRRGVPVG